MKVLMFGWEFPPHNVGGLGVACFGLTRALAKEGAQITFVLPTLAPVTSPFAKFKFANPSAHKMRTVPVYLMPYMTNEGYLAEKWLLRSQGTGSTLVAEVIRYGKLARKIAQEESYDVIHAHDWLSLPAGMAAKEVSGKPLIAHMHATELNRSGGNGANPIVYEIERRGMEMADSVVTVSENMKGLLIEHYDVPPDKITVAHNGIDPDYFDAIGESFTPNGENYHNFFTTLRRDGSKIVLFAGRITLQKGPEYFIELARRVLELRPFTYFVLAGTGDMDSEVIEKIASSGHADRILFTGEYRADKGRELFENTDLFVLSSVAEPFGLTALEAAACDTPIIVTKQSGVAEILKHALKVDFWDLDAMVHNTITLLDHPSLGITQARQSKLELGNLGWDHAAQTVALLYTSLIPTVRAIANC